MEYDSGAESSHKTKNHDGVLIKSAINSKTNVTKRRAKESEFDETEAGLVGKEKNDEDEKKRRGSWKRILLLVIAITVHNIPGKYCLFFSFRACMCKFNNHAVIF